MIGTSKVWIFCMIYAAELGIERAEGISTTTKSTTTTTDSSGTIQVPVWVIYAIVLSIIGFAALVGLAFLCRWVIRKRKRSVKPSNESDNHLTSNDLNDENEKDKDIMDSFVVTHESRKISSKPKEAVHCLTEKAPTSANVQEKEDPGIVRLNKAIEIIKEERERNDTIQDDVISENTVNHLKEKTLPKVATPVIRSHFVTTSGESVIDNLKIETEGGDKFHIPRAIVAPNRVNKKQRKPKVSALERNTRLLQSKLNRQITEVSEETDTTTEESSSSIFTESEEESEIDPSFVQSEEEDLTDDEDSCRDSFISRYHKKKMKRGTLNEATAVHLHEKQVSKSKHKKKEDNLMKSEITTLKDKCTTASANKSLQDKLTTANPAVTNCHGDNYFPKQLTSSTFSNVKQKKPIQISQYGHVPREGPIATSSFKSTTEEKADVHRNHRNENVEKENNDLKDDKKHFVRDTKRNMDIDKKQKDWYLNINAYDNYTKFEDTVMKLGKVNLNRSVSLNEADTYKDEFTSRRRKRKYQSLRQARKESVFDVLQKLDLAPKKSILKKSKSLHVKKNTVETPIGRQKFRASNSNNKETILNNEDSDSQLASNTHGQKLPKGSGRHNLEQNQKASVSDVTEKVFADRQTSDSSESIAQNTETILSFNETEVNGDEKVKTFHKQSNDRDVHSDEKDQRSNEMLETKAEESVAVIRLYSYHKDFQEKVNGKIDSTDLDLSRRDVSNRNDGEKLLSFDRLSPILPNQITHEQAFLKTDGISCLETNVGNEKCESLSESTAVISSDSETLDKVLQMKLRKKLIAYQSHRSEEMTIYDDVDRVEMPIEHRKESSAETFKPKDETASEDIDSKGNGEQENWTNDGMRDTVRDDNKTFTEHQWNELIDASIVAYKRGIIDTVSNQNDMQTSKTEQVVVIETQQMTNDSKPIISHNENLRSQQSADPSKISKDKAHLVQKIGDKTQLAEISNIQQTKCSQHSDVGDITHPYSLNSAYTSSQPRSTYRSKSPNLTRDTSSTTMIQDKFKVYSPYQERGNLFPFSGKDKDTSLTKMRDKPDCHVISRQSLSKPKELKAFALKASTKPQPKDKARPVLPNRRPKSADIFSRKSDFLDTRPGMDCIEQKNKNMDDANPMHSKQCLDELINETERRRHDFFSYRPKSTFKEMERSSKHTLESRRSKTPTFRPSYTTSDTEASNTNTQVAELKPKHQIVPLSKIKPNGLSVSHIEWFSRNLPTASRASLIPEQNGRSQEMNRASFKSKRATPMPSYNTTLLTKREKEKNILTGGVNSKISSERERPKSAMSLRSAPRPTYLETVHPTLESARRKFDRQNRNNTFGHENSGFHFTHSAVKQNMDINKKANAILQADKMELTDSDSELENFFANPDAEVLQIGSKDVVKTNFIQDSEKAFTAFTRRSKLSKSISFKM